MHFLTIQFYGEEDSDILKVEAADQDDKKVYQSKNLNIIWLCIFPL